MKVNTRKIVALFTGLLIASGLISSLSSYSTLSTEALSINDTGTGGGGSSLTESHVSTVHCADTRWVRTTYYGENGTVVGMFIMEGGVVKATYSGAYTTSTTASGGVAAHDAQMVQCYNIAFSWCTSITATDACQ